MATGLIWSKQVHMTTKCEGLQTSFLLDYVLFCFFLFCQRDLVYESKERGNITQ